MNVTGSLYLDWKLLLFSDKNDQKLVKFELYPDIEMLDAEDGDYDLSGMKPIDRSCLTVQC